MPIENRENSNASLRPILCIAALVFIAVAVSSTSTGFVFFACVACFGAAFSASSRLNQSASAFTFAVALCGQLATYYFLWCCWVISSSPNFWPRPLPYPDTIIDWMHSRLNSTLVSPFGNKLLLLVFGGISALSAGLSGWVTACSFQRKISNLTHLNARTTAIYVRCIFGCATGFFLGFFPAIIVGKSAIAGPTPLPFAILAASTLLGGVVAIGNRVG